MDVRRPVVSKLQSLLTPGYITEMKRQYPLAAKGMIIWVQGSSINLRPEDIKEDCHIGYLSGGAHTSLKLSQTC